MSALKMRRNSTEYKGLRGERGAGGGPETGAGSWEAVGVAWKGRFVREFRHACRLGAHHVASCTAIDHWKSGNTPHELVLLVLRTTDACYHARSRDLIDQLRRAALLVEASIVQGYALSTPRKFRRHLRISRWAADGNLLEDVRGVVGDGFVSTWWEMKWQSTIDFRHHRAGNVGCRIAAHVSSSRCRFA
jgi:hypothetical protein